jgi:hypothetical protein
MAPEIKFSSFGIPYLVEFANVTFRRKKRNSIRPGRKSIYSTATFSDSDWTFASISSETLAYPVVGKAETEGQGLYIRFASHAAVYPARPLSPTRAMQLKYRIADAIVKAGMDYASTATDASDLDYAALKEQGELPPVPVSSLYSGTYGQVMEAFESAGLIASVCDESGFSNGDTVYSLLQVLVTDTSGHSLSHSPRCDVCCAKYTLRVVGTHETHDVGIAMSKVRLPRQAWYCVLTSQWVATVIIMRTLGSFSSYCTKTA